MKGIVKSELLKFKHTSSAKMVILLPVMAILIGYVLGMGYAQFSACNYWGTMFYHVLLAILCATSINREKKLGYQNILCSPIDIKDNWISKIMSIAILSFVANMCMVVCNSVLGIIVGYTNISIVNCFIGCLLIFITSLWQIPLIMLAARFIGYLPTIIGSFFLNMVLSLVNPVKESFIVNPFAIIARLQCPFFKMHPNGVPLKNNSDLLSTDCVVPGLIVIVIVTIITIKISVSVYTKKGCTNEGVR